MKISTNPLVKRCCLSYILIFLLLLLLSTSTAKATTDKYPLKPPDTSSPRATIQFFNDQIDRAYQKSRGKGYKDDTILAFLNKAAELG